MKNFKQYFFSLLVLTSTLFSISCEKQETDFNTHNLIIKSKEITAYVYDELDGIANYTVVIPHKLYVKGGSPDPEHMYYKFKVAQGSTLPACLVLDTLTGVIHSSGKIAEQGTQFQKFEIEVTDGSIITKQEYSFVIKNAKSGNSCGAKAIQFSSPETSLLCNLKSPDFGVSLSMQGGVPPYYFSLLPGDTLPGNLMFEGERGLISGSTDSLKRGNYSFRIQCMDAEGKKAISLVAADQFELFNLIVK